jgi:hypothetical protein
VTILSVIQSVAQRVGMAPPSVVFSSTDRDATEMGELANEMAERIVTAHDWQRLKRLAVITGDGTSTYFDLPADYGRLPRDQMLRTAEWPLCHVLDHDTWLRWSIEGYSPTPGAWTLLGGRIEFLPKLATGKIVKYYYLSNTYVRSNGTAATSGFPYNLPFELGDSAEFGSRQTAFVSDDDFFQLDARLLRLGMIWQHRANKGLPYEEDMVNYETLLAQLVMRDQGPRTLTVMGSRPRDVAELAYPERLSSS